MRKNIHQPDYTLIVLFFLIIIFGLIMLSSASSVLGFDKFSDNYWFVKHQILFGILPGLFLFFIFSKINYQVWKKLSPLLLFISLILLVLVFVPKVGTSFGTNSKSWINLAGLSFQPAEIVKLTFILYLAAWLASRKEKVHTFAYGFLPFILYLILILGLIALQPDIGTMSVILIISLAVYFVAGAKLKHLFWLLVSGLIAFIVLIKIAPYRLDRFTAFLNPATDPQGISYHINQALLAIGSGGWFGLGLGNSQQKFQYLPEVQADSIFAIIAEELGFVVIFLFICVFVVICYKLIKLADTSPDFYGTLVVIGITTWFAGQMFINVGGMLRLIPLTGVPMPLISYGGTAIITALAAMGIIVNISKHTVERPVVNKFFSKR